MSYLLDKTRRRKKIWAVTAVLLFFAVLFYFKTGIWSGLSYVSGEIFRPVLVLGNNTSGKFRNLGAYLAFKSSLQNENEALWSKLSEADAKILNYDLLRTENESLKEILGRIKDERKIILSAVLSKPNQSTYDTLLIDAGEDKGIKAGDMVFALGDIPIGRVGAVTPNTSKIVLFSSAEEKTQAVVGPSPARPPVSGAGGNTFYELVGRGGGNFEMILPRDIVIQKGGEAVMPGLYPYVLAKVETTISDPRDPFTKVLLISPINIQEIKFVQIEQ